LLRLRPPFHVQYYRSYHSRCSRPFLESPARAAYALSQRLVRGLGARAKQLLSFPRMPQLPRGPWSRRHCHGGLVEGIERRKHRMSKASNVKGIHNISSTIATGRKESLTGSVGQYTLSRVGRSSHTARGVRFHIWCIMGLYFNTYTANTGECLKIALSCR
jgi:hypothetical protein